MVRITFTCIMLGMDSKFCICCFIGEGVLLSSLRVCLGQICEVGLQHRRMEVLSVMFSTVRKLVLVVCAPEVTNMLMQKL